ncbi:MAG: MFS transporter [Acidobacteria bacterium]|nr:MFS transporter [Acidobacteriota bacterium]
MIARALAKVGLVTPRTTCLGLVRLGQLRVLHDHRHRSLSGVLFDLRRGGHGTGAATARFGAITTALVAIIAISSPTLGAIADFTGIKKKLLAIFMMVGATAAACMALIQRGDYLLASLLFVVGNIGVSGTTVFYDSLLPHVARREETDRVSSAGYALGYLGGGLLLLLNLAWILQPQMFGFADTASATKATFVSVAVWWVVFSIPLLRRVPEPPVVLDAGEDTGTKVLVAAFGRLGRTFRDMRRYKHAFVLFLAMLLIKTAFRRSSGCARCTAPNWASIKTHRSPRSSWCSFSAFRSHSCSARWGRRSAPSARCSSRSASTRRRPSSATS